MTAKKKKGALHYMFRGFSTIADVEQYVKYQNGHVCEIFTRFEYCEKIRSSAEPFKCCLIQRSCDDIDTRVSISIFQNWNDLTTYVVETLTNIVTTNPGTKIFTYGNLWHDILSIRPFIKLHIQKVTVDDAKACIEY